MGLLLDAIVIVIIALCVFIAARKGFVRTFFGMVGHIVAGFLAILLSKPLAEFVYTSFLRKPMIDTVEDTLIRNAGESVQTTFNSVFNSLPGFFSDAADVYGVNIDSVSGQLNKVINESAQEAAPVVADTLLKPILVGLLSAVLLVLLFVLLLLVVRVIVKIINLAVSIPLIGTVNNVLGGAAGLMKGCFLIFLFTCVLGLINPFIQNGFFIFTNDAIESSFLFKLFYGLNPFL